MSADILLSSQVTSKWEYSDEEMKYFARMNFSDEMKSLLPSENVITLADVGFPEATSFYIPLGLYPLTTYIGTTNFYEYATHQNVKKQSFGMGRFNLFFHQLYNSEYLNDLPSSTHLAVCISMQAVSLLGLQVITTPWNKLIKTFFGTNPDEEKGTILTSFQSGDGSYPRNPFVLPPMGPLFSHTVVTPFIEKGDRSSLQLCYLLKNSAFSNLPENSDSGKTDDFRIVNLFLVVMPSMFGGGGASGAYALTAAPGTADWIINPKALLTPAIYELPTCFWECVMIALCIRQEEHPEDFTEEVDLWMKDMCGAKGLTARQREGQMKRIQWNVRAFIVWCQEHGIDADESQPVAIDDVVKCTEAFKFQSVTVIALDGGVLIGDKCDIQRKRAEGNHLLLLFDKGHFSLVMSHTALIQVKECTACGERFSTQRTLEAHVAKKVCLKCECVTHKMRDAFESEEEWKYHRNHLSECLYRINPPISVAESRREQRKRDEKRFPHDEDSKRRYGYPLKQKSNSTALFNQEMEKDYSPIRTWKEALYVDLESVVPFNGAETPRSQLQVQRPYAIGWLKRSESLVGASPKTAYGMHCVSSFFLMLDQWRAELVENECQIWLERCEKDLLVCATPSRGRANENYASRLKRSWDRMMMDKESCAVCGKPFEEHPDTFLSSCAKQYWARNTAEKNCMQNFNDNAPRITIWAHNGGRYDWIFIHRHLMEHGLLNECRVVRGGGRYYEIAYKGVFIFRDSLNFMLGSLDRLGKDFRVQTLKGVFPYKYLSDCSMIEDVLRGEAVIREKLPASFFQVSDKVDGAMGLTIKRAMTEEEYVSFMEERGWVYDVRVETELYLKDDISCLAQVMECFRGGWQEMPYQPELFEFCTIGQMCHTYFLKRFLAPRTYPTLDVCEDSFIRKALYGGRTEVFQRCVQGEERIHYVDVNSLYPYVMESCDLPSGDPVWHFQKGDERIVEFASSEFKVRMEVHDSLDVVMNRLMALDRDVYGFLEVDVECRQDMQYPILPERVNDKNMFTNCFKHRMVYYSEELKFAIARGCVVRKVYAWSQWFRNKVYAKCIQVLKAEKMRGEGKDVNGNVIPGAPKNPSLRAAAKTAQNALYGKSIQFINESVHIVDSRVELFKLVCKPKSDVTVHPIYRTRESDVVEVTVKPHDPRVQHRSCSSIGTAILAEARMVLYSYFEEVQRVGGTILYCDTDSIVFAGQNALPDRCLSDAIYGKMKVEIDPDDIIPGGFVALAPKCYAFKLKDGSPYVKCKGVNLASNITLPAESGFDELMELFDEEDVLQQLVDADDVDDCITGLSFDHLRMMVMGQKKKIVTTQMQFVKTRDRHVAAFDAVKLLKDQFDKRWILGGGVTAAWSDVNRGIFQHIEQKNQEAVSNFLKWASVPEIEFTREKFWGDGWFQMLFTSWQASGDFSAVYYTQHFS